MTVVEVMVGMVVLFVAVAGTLGTISSFAMLEDSSRETTQAYLEAQRVLERMDAENFDNVFARYNAFDGDDPAGAPGSGFDVRGLGVRAGDADGLVGAIFFPESPAAPGTLREDLVDASLGMPRDLNADDEVDDDDHADDYELLPVRVRVEWRGRSGNRSFELHTVLRRD